MAPISSPVVTMIRRSATAIFHGSQKTAGQMRRCSKTGQYLSPSAWAFEIVQPVDFTRHLSGKCRRSAQSGVELHRRAPFSSAGKQGPSEECRSLFRRQPSLEVHAARPARWRRRTTQGAWAAKEKGRSEDRPFIIPMTELVRSPCRPSGALATPDHSRGMGGQRKRAIRRPPFHYSGDRTD